MVSYYEDPNTEAREPGSHDVLNDQLAHLLQLTATVKETVKSIEESNAGTSDFTGLMDRLCELQSETWRLKLPRTSASPVPETIDFTRQKTNSDLLVVREEPQGRKFGQYNLHEELGRGGMGFVCKAWDRNLHRHVAIKIVLGTAQVNTGMLARFQDEAAAGAKLDHPNIVIVHDVGEENGLPYIAMQFIDGGNLAQRLKRGPIASRDAATCMSVMSRTMACAHQAGILHLDLKPANILLDRAGQPHIADFGLAKHFSEESPAISMGFAGTPNYMAPERVASDRRPLSPATDVFSLGAIFYEMLTGHIAFRAANLNEMVGQLLLHEPTPPRQIDSGIDQELEAICLKCLAKNPSLRYQSCNELADDLDSYLHGESTSMAPSRLQYRVGRLLRDTQHAEVLNKWGILWVMHSCHVLVLCLLTHVLVHQGNVNTGFLLGLWFTMESGWALFLYLRRMHLGKVTAVERVLNHVWLAGGLGNLIVLFAEWYAGLPPLALAYCLALVGCCIFMIKAGLISGKFYFVTAILFACSMMMLLFPAIAMLIFGVVGSACFLVPGIIFWRNSRTEAAEQVVMTER